MNAIGNFIPKSGAECRFKRRLPLVHYALDRMQVSYDGQHEERPLLYPLVLANRSELIAQGCTFKIAEGETCVEPAC